MCKKPEIVVFAGPNGSGKSTVTSLAQVVGAYVNADNIKANLHCTDLEAARMAEALREEFLRAKQSLTFETVLSTNRNLLLLRKAKDAGFFIRGIYVLTSTPQINIARVRKRVKEGGHDVPEDKIISRYHRALSLLPEFVELCDICHVYDNTDTPYRIFKKRKEEVFIWESPYWTASRIEELVSHSEKSEGQDIYYAVESCSFDLSKAASIEVFEHTKEAVAERYAGHDTEFLFTQVVYEITVAQSVETKHLREVPMSSVKNVRDIGSLCKFLYPDAHLVSGSGYWVEGCILGSSGNLGVGISIEDAIRIANHIQHTGDTVLGEELKGKVIYNIFYETDRKALCDTLYLPKHHALNKIPLGKVGDLCPDLC